MTLKTKLIEVATRGTNDTRGQFFLRSVLRLFWGSAVDKPFVDKVNKASEEVSVQDHSE